MLAGLLVAASLQVGPPPPPAPPPSGGSPPPPAQHSRTERIFDCPQVRVTVLEEVWAEPVYRDLADRPADRGRNVVRFDQRHTFGVLVDGNALSHEDANRVQLAADALVPLQGVSVYCKPDRGFQAVVTSYVPVSRSSVLTFDGRILTGVLPPN